MPHDPTLIVKHGDDIECHLAERILNTIPSYATFWATYIGNDGRMNSLPMPQANPTAYANRETLWQSLYTLLESLALCWQLEIDLAQRERIRDFADYAWNLNAWTAFYAHLGRIHDMAEKATAQLNERRLFAPFDPFYEKRHIALHGIKVPMRWVENVLSAPPLGEAHRQWHTRMSWTELTKADFDLLSATIASTLRELEPIIDFFFSQLAQLAPSRLGLVPVQWSEQPAQRPDELVLEIPFAGTQSYDPYLTSGTMPSHPEPGGPD